jgi:hypothetical protein
MKVYETVVEVVSMAFLAGCAMIGWLAVGIVARILWETLSVGFTLFGYWPI